MKTIVKTLVFTITGFAFSLNNTHAQNRPTITQDDQLKPLLELKEQLESENKLFNGYTIQLHNGNLNKARETNEIYKKTSFKWPASIQYETPNYKLWVGNFDSRLDADRALLQLRKDFPSAFVLKPDRK